jgi:TDG/mug DNA glycosylase family protein
VLGVTMLGPEHDADLLRAGIGFTDVVKRATANAAELTPADFQRWAPKLCAKLRRYGPRVACFHGLTGYRPFVRIALGRADAEPTLGPQPDTVGPTRIFVVPNPSPANAHFTPADQAAWYDKLAAFIDATRSSRGGAEAAARR